MPFIHGKLESSVVNGPGNRAVLWFQGCVDMNCPGCWNPETHNHGIGTLEDSYSIARWLLTLPNIEGITFSGGEPMQQAASLLLIMNLVKSRKPELTFGMYTGYRLEELNSCQYKYLIDNHLVSAGPALWESIKSYLDFAIMGRYNQKLKTTSKPLCGSSNQDIILFSDIYTLRNFNSQTVEIIISPKADLVTITGFPKHEVEIDANKAFSQSCKEDHLSKPF